MKRARLVVSEAARLGQGRVAFMLRLGLVIFAPLGLFGLLDETLSRADVDGSGLVLVPVVAAALTVTVTALLGNLLYAGALAAAVVEKEPGAEPSILAIAREAPWRTLIAIDLLFVTGLALGLVLLLVPGLIFLARYALAPALADVERSGIRVSFKRSAAITRGSRRLVLVLILAAVLLGEAVQSLLLAAASATVGAGVVTDWATQAAAQMIASPLFALISIALVLRLRDEAQGGAVGAT